MDLDIVIIQKRSNIMYFTLNDIKNLTEDKLTELLTNQVPESKLLDYKEKLPGVSKEEKIDFLGDVSSFANADGGNIIYGIKEERGVPVEINGVECSDPDKEIQKWENLIRDCTEPRLQGIVITPYKLPNGNYIFVFFIPKSFYPPHVIKIGTYWRFYSRSSASSYKIEVSELRSIFNLSSTVRERISNFRIERISKIKNRDLQIPISNEPKFIYHLIPISSFAMDTSIDLAKFEHGDFRHESFHGRRRFFNYEGFLIHNSEQGIAADWYMQIFRNGCIEIMNSRHHNIEKKIIYRNEFEKEIIKYFNFYFSIINYLGLNLPMVFFQSVLDIKGYKIGLNEEEKMREMLNRPFVQNDYLLPEIYIDEESLNNIPLTFKPLLDPIWNAAGHPQSPNYNDKGEWKIKE